jgi:translation initiation factor 2 alpha subunit (eIF-2alpha)
MKIVLQISTGKILQTYSGVEPDDETLIKNNSDIGVSDLEIKSVTPEEHYEINQKYLKNSSDGYKILRKYPEIGEQLDLLYHDMTSGKGDKTGEWYKAIKKVKDDNPKV